MTNDSKHFPALEKWKVQGYIADPFGRWVEPGGKIALPLCEGRMIGQFDFSRKGWISGKGRTAVWRDIPYDAKQYEPQFLMDESVFRAWPKAVLGLKSVGMSISAATNTRTVIAAAVSNLPCNHALFGLKNVKAGSLAVLALVGVENSLVFDYCVRPRVSGLNLSWFVLQEAPIPQAMANAPDSSVKAIALATANLSLLHRRFAPDWLQLRNDFPNLVAKEWKHWWAVTEADRLRLRVEIDALCADLYGLEPDDFDWIVRDDPKDSIGFYRVDRQLPFRERLTGLAAAAFRALKEGKWSAAKLSNDEFFEIIGIPEMTTSPDPLIKKRDGCHRWKPEEFGKDDPRYGWTWDHCWQDAVALLGSEEAVKKSIAGKDEKPAESAVPVPVDLFSGIKPD